MKTITQAEIAEWLDYDPATGILRWKKVYSGRVRVGDVAGSIDPGGYRRVQFRQMNWPATHLIFCLMTGRLPYPGMEIDHENRKRDDNWWGNLREATKQQNAQNRIHNPASLSGIKGAMSQGAGRKYRSRIRFNGQRINLGTFDTAEAANAAYERKATELFGNFARAK